MALLNVSSSPLSTQIGQLIEFPSTSSSYPSGFLPMKANSAVLQATYPDLYAQIGLQGDIAPTGKWTLNSGVPNVVDDFKDVATDGTTWLACGSLGINWTSTDPTGTWTAQTAISGSPVLIRTITSGGIWVMVKAGAGVYTASAATGPWTLNSGPSNTRAIATDGTTWLSCGDNGSLYTTTDPTGTWTANTAGAPNAVDDFSDAFYTNGIWVIVGLSGVIWTTTDPTGTWTKNAISTTDNFDRVRFGDGMWVVSSSIAQVWTTADPDGTWVVNTSPVISNPALSFDNSTSRWIKSGADIQTAIDPTAGWTTNNSAAASVTGIVSSGEYNVAVGLNGEVLTSVRFSYNKSTQFVIPRTVHTNPRLQYLIRAL